MQSNWFLFFLGLALIFDVVGVLTSLKMPKKQKLTWRLKFALFGLIPILFYVGIAAPFIRPPYRLYKEERGKIERTSPRDLKSQEDFQTYLLEQNRRIESLEDDVRDLQSELYESSRYYGFIIEMLMMGIITAGILYIIKVEKEPLPKGE